MREGAEQHVKKSGFPLAASQNADLPPEPRLEQLDRKADIVTPDVYLREAAKERTLHSYGPTEDKAYIHVPIERAMKLVANKLPVRKEKEDRSKEDGLIDAGESNSGRMLRGRSP